MIKNCLKARILKYPNGSWICFHLLISRFIDCFRILFHSWWKIYYIEYHLKLVLNLDLLVLSQCKDSKRAPNFFVPVIQWLKALSFFQNRLAGVLKLPHTVSIGACAFLSHELRNRCQFRHGEPSKNCTIHVTTWNPLQRLISPTSYFENFESVCRKYLKCMIMMYYGASNIHVFWYQDSGKNVLI